MAWTPIVRHTLIKFKNTPFDISLDDYFKKRDIKEFNGANVVSRQKLANKQKYTCPLCGQSIVNGEERLEITHKMPISHGGTSTYDNLQLVHLSCHIDHHRICPIGSKKNLCK
jgi:RNA-directed DNA polymerase